MAVAVVVRVVVVVVQVTQSVVVRALQPSECKRRGRREAGLRGRPLGGAEVSA